MKNTSRTPYIYKVTNLETHQYYIGSQCSGKTIGVNYFTSSTNKAFKEGFKTYREEKYKITIVREFDDKKECVNTENLMIRDHMLLKDGLCLNRSYCCGGEKVFSRVGTHNPHSEETKQKMSIAHKGHLSWNKDRPLPEETRKKMRKPHNISPETRERLRVWGKKMGKVSKYRINISIGDNTFDSITEASKYHNVSITAIRNWVKKNQHNAFLIEK